MSSIAKLKKKFAQRATEEMSLDEYLERAKTDKSLYANVYERLLTAIGPPKVIDTSKDERLGRLFGNSLVRTYEPFKDFYGAEQVIEKIVNFLTYAAQNLEETKQILYLLGPVGSAKSSLANRLKELVQTQPIYMLVGSPIQESPLGLFSKEDSEILGIPERYLDMQPSPVILKRLEEYKGDISKFRVRKVYPSESYQIAVGRTEPGDESTQDVSTVVGKIDIRQLESFSASDPECYSYSGGLCRANQGILDFVEMFKANHKLLHPLLSATQEKSYKGTEAIAAIPFQGLILAHSNESEWELFRSNKTNEALLDRVYIVKVPYCLRIDEEVEIYKKLLRNSELSNAPVAPGTLEALASFTVSSRLDYPKNSSIYTKLHVYNGESFKDKDPKALSYHEFQEQADNREGFTGVSTRQAFKILSQVFNYDISEVAADPVHLFKILHDQIPNLFTDEEEMEFAKDFIDSYLVKKYYDLVSKDIQKAYLASYHQHGQNLFDRYVLYADQWVQDREYRDPDTGQMMSRKLLEQELQRIEKPAGIGSPKDFRNEVVQFCLRYRSKHNGENPVWNSWSVMENVIEKNMFAKTEDILPVISFESHATKEESNKHKEFLERMKEKGYTGKQVRRIIEWQKKMGTSNDA